MGMWGAELLTEPKLYLWDFIGLNLTHNEGVAFGMRIPSPWQEILIIGALSLVIIAAYFEYQNENRPFAYGLILGGAFGNLIDRAADGRVTDFLQVGSFPTFNIADSAICIGIGLLLFDILFDR